MRPYRPTMVQQLLPGDPPKRLHFANEMLRLFENFDNIIFSDEAHFTLEATINTRNTVFWDTSNPQIIQECPLHPQKVTAWVGLASWGLVGPFFFEEIHNDQPVTVTVNSDRYGELLRDSLMPALGYMEGFNGETWFQQDGAPPHTARRIMAYLRELFPDRVISKRGDIEWPPRSPDLSPLDFYLWGYLKGKVYINNPTSLAMLKDNITREMADIPNNTLKDVINNFRKRLLDCQVNNGGHLLNIIFGTQ